MRKITVFLILACIAFTVLGVTNKNKINEAYAQYNPKGDVILNIASEYNNKIKTVKENNESVYFDIKNSYLEDGYKSSSESGLTLLTQQIGNKTRIYVKGENLNNIKVIFDSRNGSYPFNYSLFAILTGIFALFLYVVQKSYSATIKLKDEMHSVKTPMQTAANLNRSLYEQNRKKPEIVLNRVYTNPIKTEVYDFEFAKNRKNTKIAI